MKRKNKSNNGGNNIVKKRRRSAPRSKTKGKIRSQAADAGAIRDACTAARVPERADMYIESGMSFEKVRQALFEVLQERSGPEISTKSWRFEKERARIIDRWVSFNRNASPAISSNENRKSLLDAILLVATAATDLEPVIPIDARFEINKLVMFAQWVRQSKSPDGGRAPNLAAGCCAIELAHHVETYSGELKSSEWIAIAKILAAYFGLQLPSEKKRGRQDLKPQPKTASEYKKDLVKFAKNTAMRNVEFWIALNERTWIESPETFWYKRQHLSPQEIEAERPSFHRWKERTRQKRSARVSRADQARERMNIINSKNEKRSAKAGHR